MSNGIDTPTEPKGTRMLPLKYDVPQRWDQARETFESKLQDLLKQSLREVNPDMAQYDAAVIRLIEEHFDYDGHQSVVKHGSSQSSSYGLASCTSRNFAATNFL